MLKQLDVRIHWGKDRAAQPVRALALLLANKRVVECLVMVGIQAKSRDKHIYLSLRD